MTATDPQPASRLGLYALGAGVIALVAGGTFLAFSDLVPASANGDGAVAGAVATERGGVQEPAPVAAPVPTSPAPADSTSSSTTAPTTPVDATAAPVESSSAPSPAEPPPVEGAIPFGGGPVEAENFLDVTDAHAEAKPEASGGTVVGYIENGALVSYPVEPAAGATVIVSAASASQGGVIEFLDGSPDGPVIGAVNISSTGSWTTFGSFTTEVQGWTSTVLYLRFYGVDPYIADLDTIELAAPL